MHAHVGRVGVDARALIAARAKHIADRVLDAQRDEVEAFHRRLDRRHIHAQRALDTEQRGPVQAARGVVNILIRAVA
jgi:hypothetical protein